VNSGEWGWGNPAIFDPDRSPVAGPDSKAEAAGEDQAEESPIKPQAEDGDAREVTGLEVTEHEIANDGGGALDTTGPSWTRPRGPLETPVEPIDPPDDALTEEAQDPERTPPLEPQGEAVAVNERSDAPPSAPTPEPVSGETTRSPPDAPFDQGADLESQVVVEPEATPPSEQPPTVQPPTVQPPTVQPPTVQPPSDSDVLRAPSGEPTASTPAAVRPRALPRTLAIANQKGGVGKTTTAVNLGAGLADLGYRVLVIDLDPQGNATTGLGIDARNLSASVYDVLLADRPLEDAVEPTAVRNLFLVPATLDLAGAEIELVPAFSRELKLRRAVDGLDGQFDFTLIDCPPSLGLLTVNGLAAADEVLVPVQCEYYALEGLGQLLRNIQLVQSNLNPRLELSTIVLTMYDARTKLSDQVAGEVRTHFGPKVCRNIVPRTVRLSEAPSFGQPIIVFDPTSRGAIAYRELAKEVSGGAPRRAG